MADVKQILLVDDHFEMLEMLRSMLEVTSQDYEVIAVPSAEEGWLEVLRTEFDLLITDVRLPGISGFDFVRRIRQRWSDLPVIMITAYSSPQGEQEAEDLNVFRYFQKPLDTDRVLTAVHTALYGEPTPPGGDDGGSVEVIETSEKEVIDYTPPKEMSRRLDSLRADTGAVGLVLATVNGTVLAEVGSSRRLDLEEIAQTISRNIKNSFVLADQLGESNPFTLQYHTGQSLELYNASVGEDYFVTIFFDVQSRRGRIGTIWVFAQRAIKDLLRLLPPLAEIRQTGGEQPAAPPVETPPVKAPLPKPEPQKAKKKPPKREVERPAPPPREAPASTSKNIERAHPLLEEQRRAQIEKYDRPKNTIPEYEPPQVDEEADLQGLLEALNLNSDAMGTDVDSFWEQAVEETEEADAADLPPLPEGLSLGEETAVPPEAETAVEAAAGADDLLAAFNLDAAAAGEGDLDSFWDEALAEADSSVNRGLTFEQAMAEGLIDNTLQTSEEEEPVEEEEPESEEEPPELDTFWDDAVDQLNEDENAPINEILSFEEAMRRGLIPSQLNDTDTDG